MNKYAPKLSGYATASKNEYLAESFVAYNKKKYNILDPQYKSALDSVALNNTRATTKRKKTNDFEYVNIMPDKKFVNYALDPEKAPDKAIAFKNALGYDKSNYKDLKEKVYAAIREDAFVKKGDNGYGMRYEQVVEITGPNGKTAKVLTAWIQDGNNKRLVTIHVDK